MRIIAISALAVVGLSGCFSLHAHIPEDMVRQHAREEGAELPAVCSHEGRKFSEGSVVCMETHRMVCDPAERWVPEGAC